MTQNQKMRDFVKSSANETMTNKKQTPTLFISFDFFKTSK